MRTFHSEWPDLRISNPDIKAAAGDEFFVLTFHRGCFETDNEHVADVLAAIIEAGNLPGVAEFKAEPEPKKRGK